MLYVSMLMGFIEHRNKLYLSVCDHILNVSLLSFDSSSLKSQLHLFVCQYSSYLLLHHCIHHKAYAAPIYYFTSSLIFPSTSSLNFSSILPYNLQCSCKLTYGLTVFFS
ncbi:hypothetical protein VIGAN_08138700 [Vigna angularis var. angularis]|uniref:Uncharacterized protein n=1 Tax=Vigna angularis var. angularis TaxID=157739 RepID=A0A0S3SPJ7_PHAAN|nr:hypothetical protein VIGAN_08138700 [Vigna angularis var. angularis]